MNGVLIIDKPAGQTSHDVVNQVRRVLEQRAVGHLGTLDPMATGVLPLVTGSFTRLAQFYTRAEKMYEGTIRFGFATDTYDAEGEPTSEPKQACLDGEQVESIARRFRGVIEQTPPPFSAKKIHGVPAYKLARKHKDLPMKAVQVEIKEFEILSVDGDRIRFRARVASGTYMRSVAHDMGLLIGCGAHLESLRRTAVAEFKIEDAHPLDQFAGTPGNLGSLFVHPRKLLTQFPSVTVDEAVAGRIRSGRPVNLPELSRARQVKVFQGQSELIAIATRVAGTLFHASIVLGTTPSSSGSD
jgi:tRNA pseudouridine55 synthase